MGQLKAWPTIIWARWTYC